VSDDDEQDEVSPFQTYAEETEVSGDDEDDYDDDEEDQGTLDTDDSEWRVDKSRMKTLTHSEVSV
jgi:hypothetical protein